MNVSLYSVHSLLSLARGVVVTGKCHRKRRFVTTTQIQAGEALQRCVWLEFEILFLTHGHHHLLNRSSSHIYKKKSPLPLCEENKLWRGPVIYLFIVVIYKRVRGQNGIAVKPSDYDRAHDLLRKRVGCSSVFVPRLSRPPDYIASGST